MADDPPSDDSGLDLESVRPKLVATKQRWAAEGRELTGRAARREVDRLPPGQHLVKDWPVLDLGVQPNIERSRWHLRVDGLVTQRLIWDWATFMDQPQIADISDIHCVTTWSRYDNHWQGVSAAHVLALARPADAARFAVLHSSDGYSTNVPLGDLMDQDVLLAHSWEGQPLTREHGGPVRALIPKLYFWKSAKWLNRIELLAEDRLGFWEERGYHRRGDPWQEERYK